MKNTPLTTFVVIALLVASTGWPSYAQDKQSGIETKSSGTSGASLRAPLAFGLEDGTPVKMRIARTISSADAKVGDTVDFEVLEDVKIGDTLIIPRGGIAWGTITEAQPKRRMGRAGKLNVNIDSVRLVSGEKAALRAVKEVKGGGHTGAMTGAMVATSIVFFPAAPLFLFMHGKDITIPKGTEITAYINGDTSLDATKFGPKTAPNAAGTQANAQSAAPGAPSAEEPSVVVIKSSPDAAEITVDGRFVGSTPSTLRVAPGDHTITVEKPGFKAWQRTMTVSAAGSISVEANLEKTPALDKQP